VLGGLLVTDLSWRWVFYVNVPIGAAAIAFGARNLPGDRVGKVVGADQLVQRARVGSGKDDSGIVAPFGAVVVLRAGSAADPVGTALVLAQHRVAVHLRDIRHGSSSLGARPGVMSQVPGRA
jgi:MFS family permease